MVPLLSHHHQLKLLVVTPLLLRPSRCDFILVYVFVTLVIFSL